MNSEFIKNIDHYKKEIDKMISKLLDEPELKVKSVKKPNKRKRLEDSLDESLEYIKKIYSKLDSLSEIDYIVEVKAPREDYERTEYNVLIGYLKCNNIKYKENEELTYSRLRFEITLPIKLVKGDVLSFSQANLMKMHVSDCYFNFTIRKYVISIDYRDSKR